MSGKAGPFFDPFEWMAETVEAARQIRLSDADTRERVLGMAFFLTDTDADGFPKMGKNLARFERMVEFLDHVGFFDDDFSRAQS